MLIAGVGLIVWTLFSSYNIFTGQTEAPTAFEIETEEVSVSVEDSETVDEVDFQELMEGQLSDVLPFDDLSGMFGLVVWSMLAFILIFGGSSLATLGIKILKGEK